MKKRLFTVLSLIVGLAPLVLGEVRLTAAQSQPVPFVALTSAHDRARISAAPFGVPLKFIDSGAWFDAGARLRVGSGQQVDMGIAPMRVGYPITPTAWTRLTTNPFGDNHPTWSPDGTRIAYIRGHDDWVRHVWSMNSEDGSDKRQLTFVGEVNGFPDYSPDGQKLLFTHYHSDTWEDIVVKDLSTDQNTVLRSTGYNGYPRWSPDGSNIVFQCADRSGGTYHIWTMNSDGSNPTQLTSEDWVNDYPDWSPDGLRIVFRSDRAGTYKGEVSHIYVMNADGSDVVQLTSGEDKDSLPAWFLCGDYIAFSRGGHIHLMRDDGTYVTQLTDSDGYEQDPEWSPDCSKVVFHADVGGNNTDIYTMDSPLLPSLPPAVGTFEPNGGSGSVGKWADFTTTYSDPNGYEDIQWAFFFLDRVPPIASGGLAAAYYQPEDLLLLLGGGSCHPGEGKFLITGYVILDCRDSSVSGVGDTLTINWAVGPWRCFAGGCGVNTAYEFVMDSAGLWDFGAVGTWTLSPASGPAGDTGPAVQPTEADGSTELAEVLERLREEIEAWRLELGEPY